METLWINILGLSSGTTGWVLTDGSPPYIPGTRAPSGESGVVVRHIKEDCEKLIELAKRAKNIKVLSYCGNEHNDVTLEQVVDALDPWNLVHGNDGLLDLMPGEDD